VDLLLQHTRDRLTVDRHEFIADLQRGTRKLGAQLLVDDLGRISHRSDDDPALDLTDGDRRRRRRPVGRTMHVGVAVLQQRHAPLQFAVVVTDRRRPLDARNPIDEHALPVEVGQAIEEGEVVLHFAPQPHEAGDALRLARIGELQQPVGAQAFRPTDLARVDAQACPRDRSAVVGRSHGAAPVVAVPGPLDDGSARYVAELFDRAGDARMLRCRAVAVIEPHRARVVRHQRERLHRVRVGSDLDAHGDSGRSRELHGLPERRTQGRCELIADGSLRGCLRKAIATDEQQPGDHGGERDGGRTKQ
jgi:hypothetical protein